MGLRILKMSERWGDSRRDRESLDRHITGNYGKDQFRDKPNWREAPTLPCHLKNGCPFADQCDEGTGPRCLRGGNRCNT